MSKYYGYRPITKFLIWLLVALFLAFTGLSLFAAPPVITSFSRAAAQPQDVTTFWAMTSQGAWVRTGQHANPNCRMYVTFTSEPGRRYALQIKRLRLDPVFCNPNACYGEGWLYVTMPFTATGTSTTLFSPSPDGTDFFRIAQLPD